LYEDLDLGDLTTAEMNEIEPTHATRVSIAFAR